MCKKYDIIYADPPWSYSNKYDNVESCCVSKSAAAKSNYNTMTQSEICKLPIKSIANNDCVLFLWATMPQLPIAMEVIKSWGFKYSTCAFTWIKTTKTGKYAHNMGFWTLGNPELCLLAKIGSPNKWRINRSIMQLVFYERRKHSQKPDIIRDLIVRLLGDRPRIELFARVKTPGWDVWGNEVDSDVLLEDKK